jgi:sRNA-binding carbon storage regulator CsrA
MLVFSRETMDCIQTGESVVVTEMRANKMQIGIAAPKDSMFFVQRYRNRLVNHDLSSFLCRSPRLSHKLVTVPAGCGDDCGHAQLGDEVLNTGGL